MFNKVQAAFAPKTIEKVIFGVLTSFNANNAPTGAWTAYQTLNNGELRGHILNGILNNISSSNLIATSAGGTTLASLGSQNAFSGSAKLMIDNASDQLQFTNQSNIPIMLEIYVCEAKKDVPASINPGSIPVIQLLNFKSGQITSSTSSGLTNFGNFYINNNADSFYNQDNNVNEYCAFKIFYKMITSKKCVIAPGCAYEFSHSYAPTRKSILLTEVFQGNPAATGLGIQDYKGITRTFFWRIRPVQTQYVATRINQMAYAFESLTVAVKEQKTTWISNPAGSSRTYEGSSVLSGGGLLLPLTSYNTQTLATQTTSTLF